MKQKIVVLLLCIVGQLSFAQNAHVYSTWDAIEPDTCATAWLIKRFVDKDARFKFYPQGEIITEGMAFDTPDSEIRRTGQLSAFETALNKFNLTDPALVEIGKIIHDIEINYWGQKLSDKTQDLNQKILAIIKDSKVPEEALEKSFVIFDRLFQEAGRQNK